MSFFKRFIPSARDYFYAGVFWWIPAKLLPERFFRRSVRERQKIKEYAVLPECFNRASSFFNGFPLNFSPNAFFGEACGKDAFKYICPTRMLPRSLRHKFKMPIRLILPVTGG
jgi:hypothetical protein